MRAMPRLSRVILALLLALSSSHVTYAQATFPTKFSPEIAARADVKQALAFIDRRFDAQVAEWIHVTEIPGTSGHEQKRAEYVKDELVKLGFTPDTDELGNLWERRKGTRGGPRVVNGVH